MTPYFAQDGIELYHGDSREILPELASAGRRFGATITDPVWPGATVKLVGCDRPVELFREVSRLVAPLAERYVVQLGRDTDPRILAGVPEELPFLCACWLRYMPASRKARLLNGGELAYVFGKLDMASAPGFLVPSDPISRQFEDLIAGEALAVSSPGRRNGGVSPRQDREGEAPSRRRHPCPRRLEHLTWLVRWFGGGGGARPLRGLGHDARRGGAAWDPSGRHRDRGRLLRGGRGAAESASPVRAARGGDGDRRRAGALPCRARSMEAVIA